MGGDITDLTGKVVECSSTAIRLNIEKVGGEWPLDPTQWSRCSTGGQDQSEIKSLRPHDFLAQAVSSSVLLVLGSEAGVKTVISRTGCLVLTAG
ncbi:hypothetical protein RRG08_013241 [Elysia crispata]|uniref:Uncharacterized protein n=1 Tax=Elysia crispata TaxID=231223 RepID=A0AAE0Z5I2_9GAST|nr:hypothetical protein RRG08_013241 [Elysia crispata]